MIKILFSLFFVLSVSHVCLGQTYLEEVNGRPIKGNIQTDVTGSPLLFKSWKQATVLFKDGKTLNNIPMNVDLVSQTPLFVGPGNQALAFVDPIASFSVIDTLGSLMNKKLYNKLENGDPGYYLVIADGKLTLLKKVWKVVWEDKTYNSATVTRSILEKSAYYVMNKDANTLSVIKPSKKSILAAFKDKTDAVEDYLTKNKINFGTDEDLNKLFLYYNSL
jgi:hypothetical protein